MMYSTKIVALSHLSDSQELISMGQLTMANIHINFAKMLMIKYPNDCEITEQELNELWEKNAAKF